MTSASRLGRKASLYLLRQRRNHASNTSTPTRKQNRQQEPPPCPQQRRWTMSNADEDQEILKKMQAHGLSRSTLSLDEGSNCSASLRLVWDGEEHYWEEDVFFDSRPENFWESQPEM